MTAPRFLASSALRLAAVFAVIFALGGALMFTAFYWSVASYANASIRDDLRTETRILLSDGGAENPAILARRVASRIQAADALKYLVLDAEGRVLAGGLPARPTVAGFSEITAPAPPDGRETSDELATIEVLVTQLPRGSLVVGKSTYAIHELREWMGLLTIWGVIGMTVLAAIGGLASGAVLARRLDRVNAATARIMQGHLSDRMPPIGLGTEFETLRQNLNRMLDRLEASMEAIRHVSSDIAHDLRTPLNRLRHRLEHARANLTTVEAFQATVDLSLTELDQTLDIFAALLRIAQIEAGAGRSGFGPIDAGKMMQRVFEAYQPVAEQAGHVLEFRTETGAIITGDEDLLVQMVSNLVENAIVHSPAPAHIGLGARIEDDRVILAVRDNGPGIPSADLSKVTQRFYRLDHSRGSPGSGLGLALVAAIAALHDARLSLQSGEPGLVASIGFERATTESLVA